MALILGFDTSTVQCSAALIEDDRLIEAIVAEESNTHASRLALLCSALLESNGLKPGNLSAIAIGAGPGSYTGLRIGSSFAKGMCVALNIPLIAISSLKIIAAGMMQIFPDNRHNIISMIDARRDEVYAALYDYKLRELRDVKAEILIHGLYDSWIENGLVAVGDGALKAQEMLRDGRILFPDNVLYPNAGHMAKLAFDKFQRGEFEDTAYYTPQYLKDFIAGESRFKL